MRALSLIFAVVLMMGTSFAQNKNNRQMELQLLGDNVFSLSEIMLHDVANPPAAARFYAYSLLGAYEAAAHCRVGMPTIGSRLESRFTIDDIVAPSDPNISFCSNYAMLEVGSRIMPSGKLLDEKKKRLISLYRKKFRMSERKIQEHVTYAVAIASQVMKYAAEDNYNKLSTYTRYTPNKAEGHWYPTPPEYMGAVEPQWKTMRTFFLDSARQFAPAPPAAFSKDPNSAFYKMMMEVYEISKKITPAQLEIANFWDCNPFAVTYSGHLAIGLKKISPGGHWMGITSIATKKANISLDSALFIHSLVALTLHDSFVSCWTEKYASDRIRPESAINKLLDPSWRPVLQTPPFPEYTSGHSVVSSAVAEVLTYFFGDNFEFVDTSEVFFGLPERKFSSFYYAAHEAAVSRLYGGIHFRDGCEEGEKQGGKLGQFIVGRFAIND